MGQACSFTHTHTSLQTGATEGMEGRVRERGWGSRLFHNLCVCVCVCVCACVMCMCVYVYVYVYAYVYVCVHVQCMYV